ncbi:3-hydroxyisobutyryl-coenzyme A hydrolase isoform 1 [Guyanagaster necrorhizus]|uniref:3-hydroxyisobutyryl-CoA hydrolase n=1 Tax=Guyanagaster necrorhizus TaxID=856835 RepID=A0A9P8AUM6_9AGAR|nr:3-hydroxyisobutyryl-coenzyme A hydrolase isoform 1 [Guyanagaster necrorhizus MCA 3950]KAG7448221.1 3-hydroxyisobutyryl-coenzyme A hydrolase isoform 1 [Guyanagaster necrorhizus MCA 3950]
MLVPTIIKDMSQRGASALKRTRQIASHMMSTTTEDTVKFESLSELRAYTLNRPEKLNALDEQMLGLLRPKIESWSNSDLCGVILGRGTGRAFCAGGDVASVAQNAANPETRKRAIKFFKDEFELDYLLATIQKPYVALMDGITMGGGVGLSAPATFRIATENTLFAMPETDIGYCPDVGGSYYLSRLDGEIGTYLSLTGARLKGRAVFEHGLATHFIPSRRIPTVVEALAGVEDADYDISCVDVNGILEENSGERESDEPSSLLVGATRVALDSAFRHDSVEKIIDDLTTFKSDKDEMVCGWASKTLELLQLRSPTSLKVALAAIRRGRDLDLWEALNMELRIATAYCSGASSDFITGITAKLIDKSKGLPQWSPSSVKDVTDDIVSRFFSAESTFLSQAPKLFLPENDVATEDGSTTTMEGVESGQVKKGKEDIVPDGQDRDIGSPPEFSAKPHAYHRYSLPTEKEIEDIIRGNDIDSPGTGYTIDEVVEKVFEHHDGKVGIREKVLEIVERKCKIVDNADGNFVWVSWK